MQVPGPDGKFGYGGNCFPKDSQAFLNYSELKGDDLELIKNLSKSIKILEIKKSWFSFLLLFKFYTIVFLQGWMAEWLCSGLQSRLRRFDSGFSLHAFDYEV